MIRNFQDSHPQKKHITTSRQPGREKRPLIWTSLKNILTGIYIIYMFTYHIDMWKNATLLQLQRGQTSGLQRMFKQLHIIAINSYIYIDSCCYSCIGGCHRETSRESHVPLHRPGVHWEFPSCPSCLAAVSPFWAPGKPWGVTMEPQRTPVVIM